MARIVEELTTVAEGLVTLRQPFPSFSGDVGARMTMVRLDNGDLWVHSPLDTTSEMLARVREMGPIRHIVAPCRMHYLGLKPYAGYFPEAALLGTERLSRNKKLGVSFAGPAVLYGPPILIRPTLA